MKGYRVAVVGATGAVGQEMLKVLEQRNFPVADLDSLHQKDHQEKSSVLREKKLLLRS